MKRDREADPVRQAEAVAATSNSLNRKEAAAYNALQYLHKVHTVLIRAGFIDPLNPPGGLAGQTNDMFSKFKHAFPNSLAEAAKRIQNGELHRAYEELISAQSDYDRIVATHASSQQPYYHESTNALRVSKNALMFFFSEPGKRESDL